MNPTLASIAIIGGFVNASASQMMSGLFLRTSPISHSQNCSGLVWGLSTRKILTPYRIQSRTIRSTSVRIPSGSLSKLMG